MADSSSFTIEVHVQPRAKREGFVGLHGGVPKIALRAPPVDGEANAALVAYLAKELGIPKSQIEIVSGETSRHKRLRIPVTVKERWEGMIRG
ncbi:MAG: DUF167 domain-containing protein [Bdellovibrionota bacterium]